MTKRVSENAGFGKPVTNRRHGSGVGVGGT